MSIPVFRAKEGSVLPLRPRGELLLKRGVIMNNNIKIAKRLVRIAKELVGATVSVNVDFSSDEEELKAYCAENGYEFASDNGAVDRVFTVTTPLGNVEIRSDIIENSRVVYDVSCEEYDSDECQSIKDVMDEIEIAEERLLKKMFNSFVGTVSSKLGAYCDEIESDGYPAWTGPVIYGKIKNSDHIFFVLDRNDSDKSFGYSIEKWNEDDVQFEHLIMEKYSFDTPVEALNDLAVEVMKIAGKRIGK